MTDVYQPALDALKEMQAAATALQSKIASSDLDTSVEDLQKKHAEWGRKIHGIVMGYNREMQSAWKHLNAKGRSHIGFENADVTIGRFIRHAKAIQHKHTISRESSDVNKMIAKAANQLTGETGEMPMFSQRRIIDVMINDPTNRWPFDAAAADQLEKGNILLQTLKNRAAEQIRVQLDTYKPKKKGLDSTTLETLYDHQGPHDCAFKRESWGPRTTALRTVGGEKMRTLAIKITYGQARPFSDGVGKVWVKKIVFGAFRQNGQLVVHYLTHTA
jgi:hypothetical protein